MPRPQRHRRQPPQKPYAKATSRRRVGDRTWSLPDDALAGIFARLPCAADVVRYAATCARWSRVVATRAAAISRSLPPPVAGRFLPHLAAGVYHLPRSGPTARTRSSPGSPRPRFLAMPSAPRSTTSLIGSFFEDVGAAFDYSCPVASRGGRLVLELRRDTRSDSVTLCVCSPMTGTDAVVVLPPLSGEDRPTDNCYGCALLTGDDDGDNPRLFFRLLLVYNSRRGFTALRCYCSEAGRWGTERRSAVSVSTAELRHVGSAAVLRGVAFWPLDHGALGVRVDAGDPERAMDVHLLPYDSPFELFKTRRLLGVSPDNRLFFIYFGIMAGDGTLLAKTSYFDIPDGGEDLRNGRKGWGSDEEAILMHHIKMSYRDYLTLKLRWIGDRSGLVLFTVAGAHSGAHALSLHQRTVHKLADDGHSWGNALGFEMDWPAYLSSLGQ